MLAVARSLRARSSGSITTASTRKTHNKPSRRSFCTAQTSTSESPQVEPPMKKSSMQPNPQMLVTTGSFLYGRRVIREVALVSGSSVRAKNVLFDILSRVSGFFGWEVSFYSTLLSETSSQAAERMVAEAAALGADAIINVKFTMSSTSDPTAGVFVYTMTYGTAVTTEPHPEDYHVNATPSPIRTRLSNMPNNPL